MCVKYNVNSKQFGVKCYDNVEVKCWRNPQNCD